MQRRIDHALSWPGTTRSSVFDCCPLKYRSIHDSEQGIMERVVREGILACSWQAQVSRRWTDATPRRCRTDR